MAVQQVHLLHFWWTWLHFWIVKITNNAFRSLAELFLLVSEMVLPPYKIGRSQSFCTWVRLTPILFPLAPLCNRNWMEKSGYAKMGAVVNLSFSATKASCLERYYRKAKESMNILHFCWDGKWGNWFYIFLVRSNSTGCNKVSQKLDRYFSKLNLSICTLRWAAFKVYKTCHVAKMVFKCIAEYKDVIYI